MARPVLAAFLVAAFSVMNAFATPTPPPEGVTAQPFGKLATGELVTLYTLTNKNGLSVAIMDYGATVVRILAPDKNGQLGDVALGFDRFTPYLHQTAYLGAVVGRYGNRIAGGKFQLAGKSYQLPLNDPPNSLHGGTRGFDKCVWKEEPVDSEAPAIRFSLFSADGDQGYPGNVFASVTYSLNADNELRIAYQATSDQPTVINLTNHTYFNLAGHGTVADHLLTLHAKRYLPVDATQIPTGDLAAVAGTAFDFSQPTAIGRHLKEAGGKPVGFDHCYVLTKGFFSKWALAAEVEEPASGRTLKVYTDQPGVQFYSGNHLGETVLIGRDGARYPQYGGFCLETEHYPDSPNRADFPSTELSPGDTYETATVYQFGTTAAQGR